MFLRIEPALFAQRVAQVVRFDRMYEQRLREIADRSAIMELSWAEIRVFHELGAGADGITIAWLAPRLDLDGGYVCRILKKLCAYGWVAAARSEGDRRHRLYGLTADGRKVREGLEEFHRTQAERMLEALPRRGQHRLVTAMRTIEDVLSRTPWENFLEGWRTSSRTRAAYRRRGVHSTDKGAR